MNLGKDSPNERIVDRSIELWKRLLRNAPNTLPNGGPSNATPEVLEAFGQSLRKMLLTPDPRLQTYRHLVAVDPQPDEILRLAAEEAGLQVQFPENTTMFFRENSLGCTSKRSEIVWHYPLPNGKWLVTTLQGSDIDKVIEYAAGGAPKFKVDE